MELLIIILMVLGIFALIAAIWGKETAQGCFGSSAGCILQIIGIVILFIVGYIIAFVFHK